MTIDSTPVVALSGLVLDHWQQGTAFAGADASFGKRLGLGDLGITYSEVPPGKSGCPFHNHHVEEEIFIILDGEGEYRFGNTRHPVRKGDVLGAPSGGPETAHHLINTGTQPLAYLSISTKAKADIAEYPDSGKYLAKSGRSSPDAVLFDVIGRKEASLPYWEGEPGA